VGTTLEAVIMQTAIAAVFLAVAMLGAVVYTATTLPSHCPAPSARSVEGLFAPCLDQHAAHIDHSVMNQ
jgi:hypothetical protein